MARSGEVSTYMYIWIKHGRAIRFHFRFSRHVEYNIFRCSESSPDVIRPQDNFISLIFTGNGVWVNIPVWHLEEDDLAGLGVSSQGQFGAARRGLVAGHVHQRGLQHCKQTYTHSHYCTVHSRCRPAPGAGFDMKKIPKPASLNCRISKGSTKTDLNSKKNAQKFKQFATGTKTPKHVYWIEMKINDKMSNNWNVHIYCLLVGQENYPILCVLT